MVSLEAVPTTSIIDAFEEIEAAIVEIPGAFLTSNMDKYYYLTFILIALTHE
jgi:hypothetical protein